MKTIKKLRTTGKSLGVTIDKEIVESLHLKAGDFVEININPIQEEIKIKSYYCHPCSNHFDTSDEPAACNICFSENVELIEEDN